MTFNLLVTPWLEVRRRSGTCALVRPCDLTDRFDDDPIIALDFPRPDWNAAVTEFLIGLMFISMAPEDADGWAELFKAPPSPDALKAKLAPYEHAFNLDGEGPCVFQDYDTLETQDTKPISGLLIDAPGENALRNNSDLFIKRDGVSALNLAYGAAALITLQTYAPSGGAGHRTSMRGGGPLTTLLDPIRKDQRVATLWDRVWANVPETPENAVSFAHAAIFPWLSPTRTSSKREVTTPDHAPPALAFFACPRRIRLEFAENKRCDLGGTTGAAVIGFRTQNYGANYVTWQHPLSPYREDKKSGLLPLHPKSGPSDYGDWAAWWGFDGKAAEAIVLWGERGKKLRHHLEPVFGIEAFGFDMDNMKARQWLNARFPWVPIEKKAQSGLKEGLQQAIAAADEAAKAVRTFVKIALYGQAKDSYYRLPETLGMDARREPAQQLWRESEADFKDYLKQLLDRLTDDTSRTTDLKEKWLLTLRAHAFRTFEDHVDMDGLTDADPRRLLWARDQLSFAFADHTKASVRKALGLAVTPKPSKQKETA